MPLRIRAARTWGLFLLTLILTLGSIEVFLRIADFRDLRIAPDEYRLPYEYDPELGWFGIANKVKPRGYSSSFPITLNSLGLRDVELAPMTVPTILFVGDSFVYGNGVPVEVRFTERLRLKLPGFRIVNAGVAAYGTDQEYLLLRRLWPVIEPSIVVLIVCVDNDHADNSTNSVHGHALKPYLVKEGGQWHFRGITVPRNYRYYFDQNWLANHFFVVRLASILLRSLSRGDRSRSYSATGRNDEGFRCFARGEVPGRPAVRRSFA